MSSKPSTERIPLLNKKNFKEWELQVEAYLKQCDLFNFIESNEAVPSDKDDAKIFKKSKLRTSGILQALLGTIYYPKFKNSLTENSPFRMWEAIKDHFTSKAITNQSLVYNEFLDLDFEGNDIAAFIVDLTHHISSLKAVGLRIGIPKDFDLHENLLCENILKKVPTSLIHTREVLIQKRPLTLETIWDVLEDRSRDDTTTSIKTEESSMKATSSKKKKVKCVNGTHNKEANHTESQCFELHPEEKEKFEKRWADKKGKAKVSSAVDQPSYSESASVWHCIKKAHSEKLPLDTAYLDKLGDGKFITSAGIGHVRVKTENGQPLELECLHVPDIVGNLISWGRFMRKGCDIVRTGQTTANVVNEGVPLFKVRLADSNVLYIRIEFIRGQSNHSSRSASLASSDIMNLHRRAGHPSNESLKKMFNLSGFEISCEECSLSKSHRLPYFNSLPKSTHCLEFIHMDLSGRINPPTMEGYQYYFKITDQFSSFKFVYLLRKKSEAFEQFKKYYELVTVSQSRPVKNLVTDGGGEFNSNEFKEFLVSKGVTVHISAPYTPQQNPVAERGNRTTTEKARALLKQARLPHKFWGYAVDTAVFLENITPTRKNDWVSSYELWYNRPFNLTRLRPFGCCAFVNIIKSNRNSKFADTALKGIMVGYQPGMHNWRILVEGGRLELSHDVKFDEALYPGISLSPSAGHFYPPEPEDLDESFEDPIDQTQQPQDDIEPLEEVSQSSLEEDSFHEVNETINVPEPAPSKTKPSFDMVLQPVTQLAPKDISSDIDPSNIIEGRRRAHVAIADDDLDFHVQCFLAGVQFFDQTSEAPKSYSKAMKDPDRDSWIAAIEAELSAMDRLGVWEVVDIPDDCKLLNTVWIFRRKFDQHGNLTKFKARLCAAGNFQVQGENYAKTYAPTGRPTVLRTLIAMGFAKGLQIHQMDVKNAFLNGKLEEVIYLRAPAGLNIPKGKCLRLLKSIYGLKQAPRVWHHELSSFFKSVNFSASNADPCLFVSNDKNWRCYVHVYVDDMVIVSSDVDRFKKLISERYLMDDLGPMKHLLGMKIEASSSCIRLSQDLYTKKILASYGFEECRTVLTPLVPNTRLLPASPQEQQQFLKLNINYRRAIGLLNYLAVSTRPDISFAMSQLSQYLEKPGIAHWQACIHLFRYLSGTVGRGITLRGSISPVKVYVDADYANDKINSHSYYGYLVMVGDSLVSWKAKKTDSVASSTTEAEYTAMYEGAREAVWFKRVLTSLNLPHPSPIPIMADNQAAIALSKNTVFADRTKHFRVHLHWTREAVVGQQISTNYVSTHSNFADFLTKSLGNIKHRSCIEGINLTG
ncbi:hypothetical protein MJO28_017896 [Puccinia striiformis f. sp. tritici]|nr:hypothetical protein MJO28_017896 [Puccinia striiformis f. sp. tritici]